MKAKSRARYIIAVLALAVLIMALVCLFVGASRMSFSDGVAALFGKGSAANVRILRSIRVPRVLAALIAGAALSVSGLVMQTTLSNAMASPSTMGVSNAAVFGENAFTRQSARMSRMESAEKRKAVTLAANGFTPAV